MSNKRITDLTELTTPTTDDVFPVVDIATNTTTKVQLGNLPVPTSVTTALATKENTITPGTTAQYYRGDKSFQTLDKTAVGLGNVDNTSDANKPVSTATQTALNAKQDTLVSGTNIKTLNSTSLLGSGNIVLTANPSGVAGAIQFSNGSAFASDAANLFWDDTNNRLGIGTNAPSYLLDVNGVIRANVTSGQNIFGGGTDAKIYLNDTQGSEISYTNNGFSAVGGFNQIGGNTFVGATVYRMGLLTPTARLQVKGSGSTSATTSLLVQNSAGVNSLQVKDDGSVFNYGKGVITSNTAFGDGALIANTSGTLNTAYGVQALASNTQGTVNTAIGNQSLKSNTLGTNNTAIGYGAMFMNVGGTRNTAIGVESLFANTSGVDNTAVGIYTTSGNFNGSVILGRDATATGNNQFVVGSVGTNAGAVNSTTDVPATFLWSVRINGTNYKILMTT